MIKKFIIWLIRLYQKIPGYWHGACKFYPTCSSYAIEAIEMHGIIKGGFLAIKRIFKCNPWSKPAYDPVPKELGKNKSKPNYKEESERKEEN